MTTTNKSTPEKSEFNGKRILVTGGTKGVGKAIADRFLQGGGTVHGIDIIVHNGGGSSAPSGGFITVTDEPWQRAINENL
jgi:nucleoside-diphosphate-sugar epimerase